MSALTHDLETVRDWLRYAVSRFGEAKLAFGHGTTNAYDEAAYLVLHALHLPLDLGTGSGCLAILLAHAYPAVDVDAVDVSNDALTVAQRNVADYGLADRINLIRSDLFANLSGKSYDLIISNPPYVTNVAMGNLPPEYRHEPRIALAGGEDGLDAVRTILEQAARFQNPDGTLVVEVGHNRPA